MPDPALCPTPGCVFCVDVPGSLPCFPLGQFATYFLMPPTYFFDFLSSRSRPSNLPVIPFVAQFCIYLLPKNHSYSSNRARGLLGNDIGCMRHSWDNVNMST